MLHIDFYVENIIRSNNLSNNWQLRLDEQVLTTLLQDFLFSYQFATKSIQNNQNLQDPLHKIWNSTLTFLALKTIIVLVCTLYILWVLCSLHKVIIVSSISFNKCIAGLDIHGVHAVRIHSDLYKNNVWILLHSVCVSTNKDYENLQNLWILVILCLGECTN